MGLANSTVGLYLGLAFFVIPQLLAARNVPAETITGITAAAYSPSFWSVFFGPFLDVRFSRRCWATSLAALAAAMTLIAVMNLDHLVVLEIALVAGEAGAMLSSMALFGWLTTVTQPHETNKLSAWANIGIIAGTGITTALGGELVRHLPLPLAASLLGTLVFLPTAIFPAIPSRGPDLRLAGESFREFHRGVVALLRRREVLIALVLFLSPCASFALTNMLGGLGSDFHASPRLVSLAGGAGTICAGILGCLLFPMLAQRVPIRLLYFSNGVLGGLFTLSLVFLPHTPSTFAVAVLGEFLFQAVSYSSQCGIVFATVGQDNPLAATACTFLLCSTNIPVTYMLLIDGKAYTTGGIAGSLATDAAIGIVACVLMGLALRRVRGDAFGAGGGEGGAGQCVTRG